MARKPPSTTANSKTIRLERDRGPVWTDGRLFATSLVILFLDRFGIDAVGWDPTTIQMEVEEDAGAEVPYENFDRLMVGLAILTSNAFFTSAADFAHFCAVLSGNSPPPGLLILPDADDVAWGITEALLLSPPEDDDEAPLSPEITAFIGKVLDSEGILTPPDVLRVATRDGDLAGRVQYDYSDDPVMFNAIFDMETAKTDAINAVIKGRLKALMTQLRTLPLTTVDREVVVRAADKILAGLGDGDPIPLSP